MVMLAGAVMPLAMSGEVVHGVVNDASTGEPVPYATVTIKETRQSTATDVDGRFAISLAGRGNYNVVTSFVGYKTATTSARVNRDTVNVTIKLEQNTKVLGEVLVTASESSGMTSSSRIGRDAMSHLQPTSFADLLELLPGGVSKTPSMGQANVISLRETGTLGATGSAVTNSDYNISSLGTLFMVDGAPINGDANMQSVPSAQSGSTEAVRDMTNRGVDMRTISTDNIESVEVVRGIPSVEYGNLTSGLVKITRISSATPLTARFKADEYSKLFSVGKGVKLGTSNVLNLDLSYLDSKTDPRNTRENYKRITASTRFTHNQLGTSVTARYNVGLDYTGSIDNSKTDPDISLTKIDDYESKYNRLNLNTDASWTFKKLSWLSRVSVTASASYQMDRLERTKQTAPTRASIAPTSMEEGVHDGQFLLNEYVAYFTVDGKPLNLYAQAKAEGNYEPFAWLRTHHKVGADWTFSKNYGHGQIYDLTQPLSASWTTRPRDYSTIPSLQVLSLWAEENFTIPVGRNQLNIQAGVRTQSMPGLDSQYWLAHHVYVDPRVNLRWAFPAIKMGERELKLVLSGGYGMTTKMPTLSYLFPANHYNDFIQLNYYDPLNPTENSRVSLRTYIDDVTPYQLRAARNRKWEVRLGANIGTNSFSVTYFHERLNSGYRYTAYYQPYTYTKYDASVINSSTLTGPPALEDLPSQTMTVLDGYSIASNGSSIVKDGIEWTLTTARWKALATSLHLTGAWFHTTYNNSQMLYQTVSDVVDNTAVYTRYVGLYDTNDGRVNDQLSTNLTFDTQITRWGLIFTTSVQSVWYVTTKKLWQNGTPVSYLSVEDGQLHDYTNESLQDAMLKLLVKTYNDDVYKRQTTPMALYVNIKATKQVGKHLNIAVFANRMLDYLPTYKSNGITIRRNTSPYFGMELVLKL